MSWSNDDNIRALQIVDGVAYGLVRWSSDVKARAWTIAEYGALIEGSPLVGPKGSDRERRGFDAMVVANGHLYATRRGALLSYRLD